VILYMLVTGKPPFQEANDSETLIRIMDCHYVTPDHLSLSCIECVLSGEIFCSLLEIPHVVDACNPVFIYI